MPRIALAIYLLFVSPLHRTASAAGAAMPVSLVVQGSCEVHSGGTPTASAQPSVLCVHGEPFRIEQGAVDPTVKATSAQPVALTVLMSSATSPSQPQRMVWMVTF